MARLPKGAHIKLTLSDGDAYIVLREPTNEEINNYHADKYDIPPNATPADAMFHVKQAQGRLFDLLLQDVIDLEDEQGKITVERKDAIPLHLKAEIIFRRFDRVPIADEKNL